MTENKKKKHKHWHHWIFQTIKKDFFSIPISIKVISVSLFFLILWWGLGADTFFSVYINSIVGNVFWISIVWAILSGSKLFFTLPIWALDDHSDPKEIITLSKIFYVITGFLYFFAGIFGSLPILIIAVLVNGLASSTSFTTYNTFIREHSKKNTRCTAFGLILSSLNLAFVIWALLASVLIQYVRLPYLYLFIVLFAAISLIIDQKLPDLSPSRFKKLFAKETFIHQFFREVFSFKSFKTVFVSMKWYSKGLYSALSYEFLFNILDFVGFLFIPIVAMANSLSLPQIAIIFAVMRLPYVVSFFTAEIADRYNKKILIYVVLLFLSFLYTLLGFNEGFAAIITISFGIAVGLSVLRPTISGLVSDYTPKKDGWTITWTAEFFWRAWNIVGSIVFGAVSALIGLQMSFIIIGVGLFVLSLFQLTRKWAAHRHGASTECPVAEIHELW